MNQQYVIFTPNIGGMGGAQLYVIRRIKYLEEKGWDVVIVTGSINDFIFSTEFSRIEVIKVKEFDQYHFLISKTKRNKLINLLVDKLKQGTIIESNSLDLAIWGEAVAFKLKIKHFLYLLNASPIWKNRGNNLRLFFEALLEKRKIIGIMDNALLLVFDRKIDKNLYVNVPFDESEIVENEKFHMPINSENTFKIGTASRLGKKYISELIISINNLSRENINRKYALYIIGYTSKKGVEKKLHSLDEKLDNFTIYWLGTIYPLPKQFFNKLDIFVGMGTAVINSISQGVPTIVIDPRKDLAIGLLGVDVFNFGHAFKHMSIQGKINSLSLDPELLKYASNKAIELFRKEYAIKATMNKLESYISQIEIDNIDTSNIQYYLGLEPRISKFIFNSLGSKNYRKFLNFYINKIHRSSIFRLNSI